MSIATVKPRPTRINASSVTLVSIRHAEPRRAVTTR
jgi:hypothetical protein